MPELPEVQTIVTQLNHKVLHRTFVDIWTDAPKLFKNPKYERFKKELKGKKINKIERLGKNILFHLSDGKIMLAHMKMTGHLLYGQWELKNGKWLSLNSGPLQDDWTNQFVHVMFFLDKNGMLALTDIRKFAKLEIFNAQDLAEKKDLQLGPDPLKPGFTLAVFQKVLSQKPQGKIKQVLMDQNIIAGIGNIYSDEILWAAKVHPLAKISTLSKVQLKDLYKYCIAILKKAVELRGESFSDYRDTSGERGNFDIARKVYGRDKLICFRCKNKLNTVKVGGRTARFCPHCQKP